MKLTVRELLNMDKIRNAKLIAGEMGLDREILSVNVMEVPDIDNWIHSGDLLITTMYPLRDQQAKIETLIPRLHSKGLAGLVVKLHRYINDLPQRAIEQANELGFPIIEMPSGTSFIDLIQPVTSRILELQTNELLRSETIHNKFLDLVLSGGGFVEIASALARMIHCPVTIIDRFQKVLGSCEPAGQSHPQESFLEAGARGSVYLNDQFMPRASLRQAPGRKVFSMEISSSEKLISLLVCPIKMGETQLGRIIAWSTLPAELDAIDKIAIEHASKIVALKIMEARAIHQVEQRFRNEIFENLLSDNPATQAQALHNAQEAGLSFPTPFLVILMGVDINSHRSLTSAEENLVDESLYMVRRYIQSFNARAVFWNRGARLAIYFPLDQNDSSGAHQVVQNCLEKVRTIMKVQSSSLPTSAGVSEVMSTIASFALAYEQAHQSLEIGQALAEEEHWIIRHYADLGFFRVIDLTSGQENLKRFCQDTLGALLEYDNQHGTELTETLRVFLRCNQNSARAARDLFIHYNTLRYRLDCINQILGTALEQPEQRIAIEVALYLNSLVNMKRVAL